MCFSVTQNIIEWFDITRKLHNVYYQRSRLCMKIKIISVLCWVPTKIISVLCWVPTKIISVLCWVHTQVKPKTTTLAFAASQIITQK